MLNKRVKTLLQAFRTKSFALDIESDTARYAMALCGNVDDTPVAALRLATWRIGMPAGVAAAIASEGLRPTLFDEVVEDLQMVHIFASWQSDLAIRLAEARQAIVPNGMIWVSWPKEASGKPTDLSDELIRTVAFTLGLVDVKVCAVDEVWSGLKLVGRKINRL